MNTQNIKTAASESSERWGEGQEIMGISPPLAEHLKYLKIWSEERMLARDREELLFGTLKNISEDICNTVTDWTIPRPVLPPSSVQAWARAREITLTLYGESGPEAWKAASRNLADCLAVGYASYVYDF